MTPDDHDTLTECRACGGHWKITGPDGKPVICRWCTEGFMTMTQEARWLTHKSGAHKKS